MTEGRNLVNPPSSELLRVETVHDRLLPLLAVGSFAEHGSQCQVAPGCLPASLALLLPTWIKRGWLLPALSPQPSKQTFPNFSFLSCNVKLIICV